jgi:hypothetical protein
MLVERHLAADAAAEEEDNMQKKRRKDRKKIAVVDADEVDDAELVYCTHTHVTNLQ